jgi:hypothetical protein
MFFQYLHVTFSLKYIAYVHINMSLYIFNFDYIYFKLIKSVIFEINNFIVFEGLNIIEINFYFCFYFLVCRSPYVLVHHTMFF